jgi:cytochrome c biogenesis protein CcdA/thiol-disulfide isomerase/thioredoxin
VIGLLFIGLLAGLIAGVSPCILPVLPVVFAGWSAPPRDGVDPRRSRRRRALAVVAGLVLSFSMVTLVGSLILSSLGLPLSLWKWTGIVLTGLVGLGLVLSPLGHLLERPFAKLAVKPPTGVSSGFVLGLALGGVFVPCAGPVLSTITAIGSHHTVNFESVLLTLFFSIGAATPLLIVALAGDAVVERSRSLARISRRLRPLAGVLLIAVSLSIAFNLTQSLQKWIPSYTNALQKSVELNRSVTSALHALSHQRSSDGQLANCVDGNRTLQLCGHAPEFSGISQWLNTPKDGALSLSSLRGHVVLIDFWTYSCINCLRSLPHVEAWYSRYHRDGFEVIGVHSPEFDFEHVVSNIKSAARSLGVKYPIAVDNQLGTWDAYGNQYWPAEYLIDANGVVRHVAFGEGSYPVSESLIRKLLVAAHPGVILPSATTVADTTPRSALSSETYLGARRAQYFDNPQLFSQQYSNYQLPSPIPAGTYGLSGSWYVGPDSIRAGRGAKLDINFLARHVYLVLRGHGQITETLNGVTRTMTVSGFPRLYTLVNTKDLRSGDLHLKFTAGVSAFAFTFG